MINGPWAFQPYEAAGINYGVVPLPTLPDGKPMSSFLGVCLLYTSPSSWKSCASMARRALGRTCW